MIEKLANWWRSLILLLLDNSGQEGEGEGEDEGEGQEGEGEGEDEGEGEGESAEQDGGKKAGDRSQYIPRDRFDKVNEKAQKLEKLVSLGILTESEDGELQVNPEFLPSGKKGEDSKKEDFNFRFTKDEVSAESWPLVEKINKAYDYYDSIANQMSYLLLEMKSAFQVLNDYPEYIAKNSPLKKKALEIMKSDPEFKTTYKGNPTKIRWAVKRASELLAGKAPSPTKKKKANFIVGKGDTGGERQGPKVNLSELAMTPEGRKKLDEMERTEAARLQRIKAQAGKK